MKRPLLPMIFCAAAACVQAEPEAPPPDTFASYGYDNGSLPPPYREEFRATFSASGMLRLTACRGYEPESCVRLDTAMKPGAAGRIKAAARRSDLSAKPARKDPEPPIGGGLVWGKVELDGKTYEAIALPAAEDAARVQALLDALEAEVPAEAKAAVNARADAAFGGG